MLRLRHIKAIGGLDMKKDFETYYTEMKVPFVGKKFFTTLYEYRHGGRYTINANVFTNYGDAQDARNRDFPRTDSFVRAWDSREEAEEFIASLELEKD